MQSRTSFSNSMMSLALMFCRMDLLPINHAERPPNKIVGSSSFDRPASSIEEVEKDLDLAACKRLTNARSGARPSLRLGARRVAPGGPLAAAALPVLSERIVHRDATAASSSPSKAKSCWRVEPRQDRSGQRSRGKLHPRCAGRFYIVVDLVDRSETEARNGRQDRLARHLPRIDFLVLHELDHLSFAQPGDPFHLVSRLYERNSIIENPLSANGPACSAGELLNRLSYHCDIRRGGNDSWRF